MTETFEDLFAISNYQPIKYQGKLVATGDTFKIPVGKVRFTVKFEKVDSDYEQGIIFVSKNDESFYINDVEYPKGFHLWRSNSPDETECFIESAKGEFEVWNIWRKGKEVVCNMGIMVQPCIGRKCQMEKDTSVTMAIPMTISMI